MKKVYKLGTDVELHYMDSVSIKEALKISYALDIEVGLGSRLATSYEVVMDELELLIKDAGSFWNLGDYAIKKGADEVIEDFILEVENIFSTQKLIEVVFTNRTSERRKKINKEDLEVVNDMINIVNGKSHIDKPFHLSFDERKKVATQLISIYSDF